MLLVKSDMAHKRILVAIIIFHHDGKLRLILLPFAFAFASGQCKQTHIRGEVWRFFKGSPDATAPSDPSPLLPPNNPHHHDSQNLSAKNKTFSDATLAFFLNFLMKIIRKLLPNELIRSNFKFVMGTLKTKLKQLKTFSKTRMPTRTPINQLPFKDD